MSGRPFKRESWRPTKRPPTFPAAIQQPPVSSANALPARTWGGAPVPTAPKRFERDPSLNVKEEEHSSRWDDRGSNSGKWDQRDDRSRYGNSGNGKRRHSPSRQLDSTRDERFSSARRSYSPSAPDPSPADSSNYPATRRPLPPAQPPAVITVRQLVHVDRHQITVHRDLRPKNGKVVREEERVLTMELDRRRMRQFYINDLVV